MEKIEIIMMIAFIAGLLLSFWKLYVFMPKKVLADDDTTSESINELTELMILCIVDAHEEKYELSSLLLYKRMLAHEQFDQEHFWRFNQNKLNHLLLNYYAINPEISTFRQIYEIEKKQAENLSVNPA